MSGTCRARIMAIVVVAFLAGVLQGCSGGERGLGSTEGDKAITIGEVKGYADDVAINALWKHLLEQKGWNVKIKSLQLGAIFAGLATGDLDAYLDVWLPTTHGVYVDKYKDKLKILKTAWNKQAKLGLAVPDYVNIKTLEDLRTHSDKFGGKIVGIEAASGEMKLLRKKIMPAYGLDKKFTLAPSSSPSMLASLKAAIDKKQPVVVVLWKPHWAWSKFDIRFLGDPNNAWPPPETVHIGLSEPFANGNPKVSNWFKRTKLNASQLSSLMLEIEENDGNADKGVRSWLKEPGNRRIVDGWTDA